jgi:uncharacterized protein with HEPN domain
MINMPLLRKALLPTTSLTSIEATERIDRYTGDMDEVPFLSNQLVQDAVIRNFEIIGEASKNIEKHYPDFASSLPELPLSFAYQMRNAVAHGYFKVDFEIVWKTIHGDLPGLHAKIQDAQASVRNQDIEGMAP